MSTAVREQEGPLAVPGSLSTFVDIVRWRAEVQPDSVGYTFMRDGEADDLMMTFAELDRRARGVAALLQSRVAPGDRALLVFPSGLDYIAAFFGCLYAGVVAVPAYPPRMNRSLDRLQAIARNVQAAIGLTDTSTRPAIERAFQHAPALQALPWLGTDTIADDLALAWAEPMLDSDTIALLQYTSGSTSSPKGVMLSHQNLIHNHVLVGEYMGVTSQTRAVFWLPPYHDMGLVSGVLQPSYFGNHTAIMSPVAFLQRPLRWLQAVSRIRATISGGPNFAYDLCARAVTDEQIAGLDLSSWEVAFVGAEPVRPDVLSRFAEVFAPCGFRSEALYPCYGLAEAMCMVTGGQRHDPPVVQGFQQEALEAGRAVPGGDAESVRRLVGCGYALESQEVRIVDPLTHTTASQDRVGEIWVRGPSVSRGYWQQPMATEATFDAYLADTGEGPYLRTGDLGFVSDGELFVAGRIKELIIIRGRNLYPQDLEMTVERSHPALRPNGGAAFALNREEEELLVVVHEVERTQRKVDLGHVCAAVRQAVADEHEVGVYAVVLVRPGSVPRTSSGKIQRGQCRKEFVEGGLQVLEQSALDPGAPLFSPQPYIPPRTELEERLAALWQEALRVERVGIEDSFFALGGDSLLVIQVVSRAREAGIDLTVEQFLESPTIAGLSADVTSLVAINAEQGVVTGPVPLTPRQHLFFEHASRHLQAERAIVEVLRPLNPALLERAIGHLIKHHDALRMRFDYRENGPSARIVAREDRQVFSYQDLSDLPEEDQGNAVEHALRKARKRIDMREGPLMRMALLERGHGKRQLLLFAIHHLIVDGLSISVLEEDLETAYGQLERGEEVQLPAKTTSVQAWAERLVDFARSSEARRELEYWLEEVPHSFPGLPIDHPAGVGQEGRLRRVLLTVDPSQTAALLDVATGMFETQIDRLVVGALAVAVQRWTGQPRMYIEYTGHGREPLSHDIDLSRTVGWFTSRFPVMVSAPPLDGIEEHVRTVARRLKEVPHGGIGYGILRYLSADAAVAEALARLPRAEIGFNFQGHLDRLHARTSLFNVGPRLSESASNRRFPGTTWMQVMSNIWQERLHVRFEYHESVYAPDTIQSLADGTQHALLALVSPSPQDRE